MDDKIGFPYYNLALGDRNQENGKINAHAVTNNQDIKKILATVAAIALKFTDHFPDYPIHAKGSTAARTRLYQIAITTNWKEIHPVMDVFGYLNNKWEPFKKNVNYEAFVVRRKKGKFDL